MEKWQLNKHILIFPCRHWMKTRKHLAEMCYETLKALQNILWVQMERSTKQKIKKIKSFSCARQGKLLWYLGMPRLSMWSMHRDPGFSAGGGGEVFRSWWWWPHPLFSCVWGCFTFAPDFVVHGSRGGQESWKIWAGWELFRSVELSVFNHAHSPYLIGMFKSKHSFDQIISFF